MPGNQDKKKGVKEKANNDTILNLSHFLFFWSFQEDYLFPFGNLHSQLILGNGFNALR